ncbi:MAG TPA: ABC transporter permease [Gammaproteobacteria bacterium]|nr:ABC transporter permease [Gammaproteobacteria bacterium]
MNVLTRPLRGLIKRPGLPLAMIAMLSLGIGATTAIFSVFHQVLVRPLPVPDPERLVNFGAPGPKGGRTSSSAAGSSEQIFSYPMYRDLAERQQVFTGVAAQRDFRASLAGQGSARMANGILVSGSYFSVLGLEPAAGRLIGPDDEPKIGEGAVAVLSYDYWQSGLGGAPDAIGRRLTVNGHELTIVGVAPKGFEGTILGFKPQVFVPLTLRWLMEPQRVRDEEDRRAYWIYLFARLKPGVAPEQASATLNVQYSAILNDVEAPLNAGDLSPDALAQFRKRQITLDPGARGRSQLTSGADRPLELLLGITALVLLIVCFNVANLLLARGVARAGELAVRASIGASRLRLVLESLLDAAVPAAIGAALSVPVAAFTLRVIGTLIPADLAESLALRVNATALFFAMGVSLAAVLLLAAAPAAQASRTDPAGAMKGHAAQSLGVRGTARLRGVLATVQVAFSMLLLVTAGLFARSLANVASVDLGVSTDSIVTFTLAPRLSGATPESARATFALVEERLAAQPGVMSVGAARIALLTGRGASARVTFDGVDALPDSTLSVLTNDVNADFFDTVSIPLLAGRRLTVADEQGAPLVAVVNESFVRQYALGADALGKRFSTGAGSTGIEIVGIVQDARYRRVKADVPAQIFTSYRQNPNLDGLTFYVRGAAGTDALLRMIPRVVTEIDPGVAVGSLTTFDAQVDDNVFLDRLTATLATGFASLATLLAALGLYGVLAYGVAQRTRELGLRLALGATPRRLRGLVVKQVAAMTLIGAALGLSAALALGRFAESLLFGLSARDPLAIVAASVALTLVALGAAYLPARRATAVDPLVALRHD